MKRIVSVALPKGRLGEKAYSLMERAGYGCPALLEDNRKLTFENEQAGVRYFWVKPSDVPIYVERGAADVGIAGKDVLMEYAPDLYALLDLDIGKCSMCVAGFKGFRDSHSKTLRVATKFPNIARAYFAGQGREIDVIKLNGSIELAPILGLSDVIVDLVETGKTLAENGLAVLETISPISARLVANKASLSFRGKEIEALRAGLEGVVVAK
jgi:ATP phosphoribosyltransferase/ATP phosphoribosyltransferase regulatory subunit